MRSNMDLPKCDIKVLCIVVNRVNSHTEYGLEKWRVSDQFSQNEALPNPNEALPSGSNLTRKNWVTLNRSRSKVGKN